VSGSSSNEMLEPQKRLDTVLVNCTVLMSTPSTCETLFEMCLFDEIATDPWSFAEACGRLTTRLGWLPGARCY
jgi:hypothetical protein